VIVAERVPDLIQSSPARRAVVRKIVPETPDTSTYWLSFVEPSDRLTYFFRPGQFNMLYLFGSGEVPISLSSAPGSMPLAHTIRHTGRVTDGFGKLAKGDEILIRGPFGRPWPLAECRGRDVLIVAGGLGLAPVRPAIYHLMENRRFYERVIMIVGARAPEHMLYRTELSTWFDWAEKHRIEVHLTVDIPDDNWPYHEGVVTTLFDKAELRPDKTTTFMCGPEIMMHFAALGLLERDIDPANLYLSFERNMQCGEVLCGHCQLGAYFVCHDGPVFSYAEIGQDMKVREL
jgi:NAD(P)H-flavin reductase